MKLIFVLLCLVYGSFGDVLLKDIGATFTSAIGIDYHYPTNSLVMSVNYGSGGIPYNFQRLEFDGTGVQFGPTSGLSDEVKIATVKEDDTIEAPGTLYVGTGVPGQIARVAADGSSESVFVNLPGETGLMRGSLFVDRSGVWNYHLIVVTSTGGVWRIDRQTKAATRIASTGVHLEGVITVGSDPRYGFLGGKILAGAEEQGNLWWFDVNGNSGKWPLKAPVDFPTPTGRVDVEDIDLIEGNFYAVAYGIGKLLGAAAADFSPYAGDLLLTMEFVGLFVLTWDSTTNLPKVVGLPINPNSVQTSQYEHVTFAPFGILNIPDPCSSNGTYHTQSEGDWGDKCSDGFQTGCYRDSHFARCFPHGLDIGCACAPQLTRVSSCGFGIHFDTSQDIENYLPQLGNPAQLDHTYTNPSNPPPISTSSGNFGGQLTALALSLGFESCDPSFHSACGSLGDLYVCDDRCERCKRNNGACSRNSKVQCKFVQEREEDEENAERNNKNNNKNDGKPKYANCEAFFGLQVKDIFAAANDALGGCGKCAPVQSRASMELEDRNNKNCVRNSKCRKSEEARNNKNCNRNSDCKKNSNCCCCVVQSADPLCDPIVLNACITLINQGFIFGKQLDDVDSGNLFSETPCGCGKGFEWTATVNGQTVVLTPFQVNTDIQTYYGYNKAGGDASSANTPGGLEDNNLGQALVEFVTDGFSHHNLLVIYDKPNNGKGGSAISTITHTGILSGADFVVKDDPDASEAGPYTKTATTFGTDNGWAPCCTDGYVLGPIPNLACFTFQLGATTGITSLRLSTDNGAGGATAIQVPKTDGVPITVDICNRCIKKN